MSDEEAQFVDFVRCMLDLNPKRRQTAEDLLRHQWLEGALDAIS